MCYKDGHCRSIENKEKLKHPSKSERTFFSCIYIYIFLLYNIVLVELFLKNLIKLWKKQSTDQDLSSKGH